MNLHCKSAWIHYKVGVSRDEMPDSGSGITGSEFPEWRFPSYRNWRFPRPDRRCKTVRNTQFLPETVCKVEKVCKVRSTFYDYLNFFGKWKDDRL